MSQHINTTLENERLLDPRRIVFGLNTDEEGNPLNESGQTVHVSRKLLKEGHIHVRGRTRSGKTSLAIAPLLQQLIKPYPYCNPSGDVLVPRMKDPIFIFDLGGDLSLFNFVKHRLCETKEKDEQGKLVNTRKFRFLSLKKNDDWDYFDPFQIVPAGERDLIRLAQILIEAFNQDYGLLYGAAYYSMRSLSALLRVAKYVVSQNKQGKHLDFRDVGEYFKTNNKFDRDEAQIKMAFEFLMNYQQLQSPPPGKEDRQINMRRALDESEVVYFFCPSMGQATTARQIAGLGLYTLLTAAQLRKDSGENQGTGHRHAWVIVDEFHELAGRSFASLLAQSSKFGVSLILANQTTTQLETRDVNLAHVVRDNTLAKIYFTVTGKQDFEDLQGFSLEDRQELHGRAKSEDENYRIRKSVTVSESLTTKLHRDTILSTSYTSKNCFLILDDGSGHREPQRIFTDYTIYPEDFLEYKNKPIDQKSDSQATTKEQQTVPTTTPAPKHSTSEPTPKNSVSTKMALVLRDMLREKKQQEQPDYIQQYYGGLAS